MERAHKSKLEQRLADAARMIDALDRATPGLKQLLKSKGIGDNAVIANMLISHANTFHAKQGR